MKNQRCQILRQGQTKQKKLQQSNNNKMLVQKLRRQKIDKPACWMWIKLGLNQNSSCTNEKLGDSETDWLGDELGDWPGKLAKWPQKRAHGLEISVRASGAGIKREGLLYLEKYGIGGPEFGIKEEFATEKGRRLFHARAWTERLVVYSSANWLALMSDLGQIASLGAVQWRWVY